MASRSTAAAPTVAGSPFSGATGLEALGEGRYRGELGTQWAVGPKAHGGMLLVLMAKAALARLDEQSPGSAPDPLAVAADFLRAPDVGPVEMTTEILKTGRTTSVVAVRMTQGDRLMLTASITAGVVPDDEPVWTDLPEQDAEPGPDSYAPPVERGGPGLAGAVELRYDPSTIPFVRDETGPPVIRGWVRPYGEEPDVLFALLAGDILPPTVFNLTGKPGWAPTVQLTALLRGRPAPGWLRVDSRAVTVGGQRFDEDLTVVDSAGRLVCQARQLALYPL